MLELNSIYHAFGPQVIFEDFSLKLEAGDRCVIRGTNGSGKSTLLRIIAGLLVPNSGAILRPKNLIGYLSPDLVLYDDLTLLENLNFFANVRGVPAETNPALLQRVGLGDRMHDLAGELSTGLGQRLKLAYALQGSPGLLLLDEPTSNLDDEGHRIVEETLRESAADIVVRTSFGPLNFDWANREVDLG